MSEGRLLVVGAGGHGRVVADSAELEGRWSEIVFFDDLWPERKSSGIWPIKGRAADVLSAVDSADEAIVAIGDNQTRLQWLAKLQKAAVGIATVVHPDASVSPHAEISPGVFVAAGAVVAPGSRLGFGVIVNTGSSIDHDCILSEGVHACPGARLAGAVRVGRLSWIGIGCSICQEVVIGTRTTIGAGSVVIDDVEDGLTVVGVPARPTRTRT